MIIVKEGTVFELVNYYGKGTQPVQFTEKLLKGGYSNGTTNEEVVNMMIERFCHLQKVRYSPENQHVLFLLKDFSTWKNLNADTKMELKEWITSNNAEAIEMG